MTNEEQAQKLLKASPKFRKKDIKAINAQFSAYIFRRSKTREVWTTCCGTHKYIPEECTEDEYEIMMAEHTMEKHWIHGGRPKVIATCPYCGAETVVKELGRTGQRKNLEQVRSMILFRWYRDALWAIAFYAKKNYLDKRYLTEKPRIALKALYRFRPNCAEMAKVGYYENWYYVKMTGKPKKLPLPIENPFPNQTLFSYETHCIDVIGQAAIEKSPFRYCKSEESNAFDRVRFLALCTIYPRQVEMFVKADMKYVVDDVICRRKWNARAVDWTQTDPRKAFGLNGQELKAFLKTNRELATIAFYHRQKKKGEPVSMEWAAVLSTYVGGKIMDYCKTDHVNIKKFVRYLERCAQDTNRDISHTWHYWNDYRRAAEAIGLEIWKDNVLYPKNLLEAHDMATARHQEQIEAEWAKSDAELRRREAEQLKDAEAKYLEKKKSLKAKYEFSYDDLKIEIPESGQEIIDEGRILKHCVAGYANRHLRGAVTILFLRHRTEPDEPFVTIQIDDNRLVQIHGYRNEGIYTAEGQFAPDPEEVHKEFLTVWIDWLEAGSKRKEDGSPKLPKKRKERVA